VITRLELGGAQTHVLSLIRGIDRDKYNVFLFSAAAGELADAAAAIPGLIFIRSRFLDRTIHPLKDCFALIALFFIIKKNRIDVVHTHSSKAGILGRAAARLAGVRRIVHTVHGWSFNDHQPAFVRRCYVGLERYCARFTDALIIVSAHDHQTGFRERIQPRGAYALIRCGIDASGFAVTDGRGTAREALGFQVSDKVVGMIACFKPQKAPLDFVAMAVRVKRQCPAAKFLLIGDGVLRPAIIEAVQNAGLDQDFVLAGWRRDIPVLLSAMDVFVLTSLWEGLPIAVMEAMAAGVPVLVTDTGGVREIIHSGENGYCVPPGNVDAMTQKVMELLNDPELRDRFSTNAQRLMNGDEFSTDHMLRCVESVYAGIGKIDIGYKRLEGDIL
jgi:glycosyltransferase involved in cell wall biosynthesis